MIRICLLCLLLLFPTRARAQQPAPDAEVIDGVAAVVGTEIILQSELASSMRIALAQVQRQQVRITPELIVDLRDRAIETLIDDKLILQIARDNRLEPTDEQIDLAIEGIAEDEGLEVEEIYAAADEQGLSRAAYREQLGLQMSRMRVMSGSVAGRISVSDEEVRALYDERYGSLEPGERFRVLHIVLQWNPEATDEGREEMRVFAAQLREQALDTGQFAALARQYSDGPTAASGGLTVFKRSDAPPDVVAALEQLSPGEISPLIESSYGLNLFQYLDSFDPTALSFEEIEQRLRAEIRERKTMPEFEEWLAELKANRYVEILGTRAR